MLLWPPPLPAFLTTGYGVQALTTGQGALGSLAVFGDSFNAAN